MNIWIKRSLSTAAITGGLIVGGAAAASASDALGTDPSSSEQQSSSSSESSFGAPLEIGGLTLGSSSESSSSSTESSTQTDGDRSTTSTDTTSDSSKNHGSITTEPIRVDLQGALSQQDASRSANQSTGSSGSTGSNGTGSSSSEQSSESSGEVKAPISIGGLTVENGDESTSATRSERTAEDGDRSTSSLSESSEAQQGSSSFGIGALELDPQAAFGETSASSSDRLGGRDGIDESAQSSSSESSASLPISFEGITASNERERESAAREASEVRDGDRFASSDQRSHERDHTRSEAEGGGFSFAPGFSSENAQARESSRLGDEDGLRDSASSSASHVEGEAPFSFDGFSFEDQAASERATHDERAAGSGDREVREVTQEASASERSTSVEGGAFEGHPSFGSSQERAEESSSVGDLVSSLTVREDAGHLAFPFSGGAFSFTDDQADAFERATLDAVRDGDRSSERTTHDHETTSTTTTSGFEGFSGDPRAEFRDRVEQLTQQLLAGIR